jgi:hypothetical protein
MREKIPIKVNNILTKDASSFQDIKNKFLNLHSASGNGDSAYYIFGNKKHKKSKQRTKSSSSGSSNSPPSFSKDIASTNTKACT